MFTQPSLPELRAQPIDAFTCDSGYATSTGSTPWMSTSSIPFDTTHHRDPKSTVSCTTSTNDDANVNTSSRTSAPPESRCSCLQQQVQLVYQLSNLDDSASRIDNSSSVERVLGAVQSAQGPWKALMQCLSCQSRDNQKEVFLLFAMSIRILLTSVQKIAARAADDHKKETLPRPLSFKPLHPDIGSALPVHVGCFELTGSTKDDVIRLALRQALQTIQSALLHLCERRVMSRTHHAVDAQASHRARDTNDWTRASECHDFLAHFDSDASVSPPSIDLSRRISHSMSRQYEPSTHQSGADFLSLADTNSLFGDDDFGNMLETLHSSMSAVE